MPHAQGDQDDAVLDPSPPVTAFVRAGGAAGRSAAESATKL